MCPNSNRLLLKPDFALKEPLQQITYQAFLLSGGKETLLTSGVTFSASNPAIAQIGGASGKCSTVGPGICSISATWQGNSAYGQLEVIADCKVHETDFVILIDDSKSMSTQFSNLYQSKLSFAKTMATGFIDTIDLTKDRVAVFSFADASQNVLGLSHNAAAVKAAIKSISTTTSTTDIKGAMDEVIAYLKGNSLPEAVTTQVIVLFTDGENKTGGNPLPAAAAFEAGGNIILIVGCRAYDGGFMLLEAMASGGFFINAFQNDQDMVANWLSGLKGYICSGNCKPPGDRTVPIGQLDYNKFINWDVSGKVDLLGNASNPYDPKLDYYNFLPGNGLYLDMQGSSAPFAGVLTSKTAKSPAIVSGTNYSFSLFVAGNQRENKPGFILGVNVRVNGVNQVNSTIQVDNWLQGFTKYTFAFTANQTGPGIMSISSLTAPGEAYFGLLVDVVEMTNTDTAAVIFHDDFDGENPVLLPPNCQNNPSVTPGQAPIFNYPPCYSSGCLDNPIPAQLPDPFPTTDVEGCGLTGLLTVAIKSGVSTGTILGDSDNTVLGDSDNTVLGDDAPGGPVSI